MWIYLRKKLSEKDGGGEEPGLEERDNYKYEPPCDLNILDNMDITYIWYRNNSVDVQRACDGNISSKFTFINYINLNTCLLGYLTGNKKGKNNAKKIWKFFLAFFVNETFLMQFLVKENFAFSFLLFSKEFFLFVQLKDFVTKKEE